MMIRLLRFRTVLTSPALLTKYGDLPVNREHDSVGNYLVNRLVDISRQNRLPIEATLRINDDMVKKGIIIYWQLKADPHYAVKLYHIAKMLSRKETL